MSVKTYSITLKTKGNNDVHDITAEVSKHLKDSGLKNGIVTVFVPGSTGGVTTIEYESGVIHDMSEMIERLVPSDITYKHNLRWGDGNGFSHVRSALIGTSLTIPFSRGDLVLGTWQQIVFIDFDNRPRRRELILQVMGE